MPGGGGRRGGTRRGCPESVAGEGASTPQGRVTGRAPGPTGSPFPLCRAPCARLERGGSSGVPGRRARRAGRGDAQEQSGCRHRPHRGAGPALPGAAMERPGRRKALQRQRHSVSARRAAVPTAGRAKGGVRREKGTEGDTMGAGGPGSRRRVAAASGAAKWSEAGPRRRRSATGSATGRPVARGGRSSRAVRRRVRGSRCPGAGGPGALGVRPTGARPSRPAAEPSALAPAGPRGTAPPFLMWISTQTWCTPLRLRAVVLHCPSGPCVPETFFPGVPGGS